MKDEITNPMFKYAKKYDTDNKASVLVKDGKGGTHAIRLSLLSHADDQFVAFDSGADGCLEVYPISPLFAFISGLNQTDRFSGKAIG